MVSVPYAVGFALATGISSAITWRAMQVRERTEASWFAVAMGGVTWWSSMKLIEVLVAGSDIQLLFNALHWIGVGAVSIGVLGFGLSLRGRSDMLTPLRIGALSVIPTLTVSVWIGDPRVVGLLESATPIPTGVFWVVEAVESTWPWFEWVSLFYLWGLVAIGSIFVLETALERPKLDPSRLLLGVMVAVPWTVNILYELDVIPSAEFDPTVLGFVVTGVAGIATIDRFRLFDVPFARSQIVEKFSTPIIVYGRHDRLYDYNTRAAELLDLDPTDLDRDVRTVLADSPLPISDQRVARGDLAEEIDGAQVSVPSDEGEIRHFTIQVSALHSGTANARGFTIQLADITEQHRQYEQTRRERDLKELIRRILVKLSARDEIEQAFCDQLVTDDRYSGVWIGEYSTGDEFTARTYARSDGAASIDQYEPPERIKERGLESLESGDVIVIDDPVALDEDPLLDGLSGSDMQRTAVIPLAHNELTYGILVVYTSRSEAFEPTEQRLLADLGESVGFAINAIEQREALQGEQIREARLRITDPDHYLVSLANMSHFQNSGASIDAFEIRDGSMAYAPSNADSGVAEHLIHFLTVRGVSAAPLIDHLRTQSDVQSVTRLQDGRENVSLRVLVRPPSVGSLLAEAGGRLQTIHATDGGVVAIGEFSPRTDMNQMNEHVREEYPGTTIQSLVTTDPTEIRPDSSPLASLTAKQRQALEAAYRNGFFERPQRQTADEIASTLDVSRSTFLNHLRTAENTLLTEVFGTSK